MAEGLFQKLQKNSELDIEVQSAGVSTFEGQQPSKHTLD
ncbi:MAG: low molecular weight phosphatase family protein, partial [Verrucomicrobiaceae bacterium]|nr:low molecular weight phosphatase family protein [Verrucomicrobiaceae bacterium]